MKWFRSRTAVDSRAPALPSRALHEFDIAELVRNQDATAEQVLAEFRHYGPWRIAPRARYNYACLLVDLDHLDNAVEELRELVLVPFLAARAKTDPALDDLRNDRMRWSKLFPAELHDIAIIGTYWAEALEKAKISSVRELGDATASVVGIGRLATQISAPDSLVARWAGMACLIACGKLTAPESNLLEAANVSNVAALAAMKADELANLLEAVNASAEVLDAAPSKATVEIWVSAAKQCLSGESRDELQATPRG